MILITHNDLDGVGCEIVARCFYPELSSERIYHRDYDEIDDLVKDLLNRTQEKIIITDISVHRDTAEEIAARHPGRVELFDHHRTVVSYLQPYDWAVLDMSKCATRLFFDTLRQRYPSTNVPAGLETFVSCVNDYDLWIHDSPISKDLNDMLFLMGIEIFAQTMSSRISRGEELIQESDRLYLKGHRLSKERYFKDCLKKAVVDGNRLSVVASRHISELCQYIRDENRPEWKSVDYIDVFNFDACSHSLRSYRPDFDVSAIAQANGGGGHPKAAGHPMKFHPDFLKQC